MFLGTLRFGAICMALAAVLHLGLAAFAGTGDLVLALGACLAAAGLWRGWRWWAWIVLFSVIVAIGLDFARLGGSAPDAMIWALIAVDLAAVVSLFVALWRPRPQIA